MSTTVSRRRFLGTSARAAAAWSIVPQGRAFGYSANERLNIALVGIGGRGAWFVDTIPRIGENVVAVWDILQYQSLNFVLNYFVNPRAISV